MATVVLSENSSIPWNEGEHKMHLLTQVPESENPGVPYLTRSAASMLARFPLLAIGTVDSDGRPWVTIWGGEAPLAQMVSQSVIGVRAVVDGRTDPVVQALYGGKADGEVVREQAPGRMIAGLTLHLEQRNRVKLYGRLIAGALSVTGPEEEEGQGAAASEIQMAVKIEESLGNCPKYMNCKRIYPSIPEPKLISDKPQLSPEGIDLLKKADMFFVSSSYHDKDMDTNHRGGPPGFVRVESNDSSGAVIVWPDYSGNNLFQTLGNLQTTPKAGLVFPDFETSDVLYLTGDTEVLIGKDASAVLPHSRLAVRLTITSARFVAKGLPFRGETLERSPYNPKIRYLKSEAPNQDAIDDEDADAKAPRARLIKNEKITPSIYRVRFAIQDPPAPYPSSTPTNPTKTPPKRWEPGQYAALSFKTELDMGYSHMRDDDPQSLNDDYLRTFTISSHPHTPHLAVNEFEMTIRNVGGAVTSWLSHQKPPARQGAGMDIELPLRGIGGDFSIAASDRTATVRFIAGGIGITPLLAQLPDLDLSRLRLFWSLPLADIRLVQDTFAHHPGLAPSTHLFLTHAAKEVEKLLPRNDQAALKAVVASGATVDRRRLRADDLLALSAQAGGEGEGEGERWYLCAAPAMRTQVLAWLPGRRVEYESFNY